jgi:protocatechuate 3,4-dioxygenase beta subunit
VAGARRLSAAVRRVGVDLWERFGRRTKQAMANGVSVLVWLWEQALDADRGARPHPPRPIRFRAEALTRRLESRGARRGGSMSGRPSWLAAGALLLGLAAASRAQDRHDQVGVPRDLTPETRITPPDEPGDPFVVSGTVFGPDGRTPAEGVIVYAYQTDAKGYYRPDQKRGAPPRLRGWMKTGAGGRYELRTIRPAPYPNRSIPAHIHLVAWGPGVPRQEIEELRFEDDPLVTASARASAAKEGRFAAVRPVQKGSDGVLRCTYDIRLKASSGS